MVRQESTESSNGREGTGILAQLVAVGSKFPASSKGIFYSRDAGSSLEQPTKSGDSFTSSQDIEAVNRLNKVLENYFGSNDYGMVPYTGREASVSRPVQEAIRVAFGKRTVLVSADTGSRDIFNGFAIQSR